MNAESRIRAIVDTAANSGEASPVHDLLGSLQRNAQGAPLPTLGNIALVLAGDPKLQGLLGYNEFSHQPLLMRPPPKWTEAAADAPGPFPRAWEDPDVTHVTSYLQRLYSPKFSCENVGRAMAADAILKRFHPPRAWLKSLRWDGTDRLDYWMIKALGAEDTDYIRAVAAKFMIAAVRRLRQPGVKFDHMPVLEGAQGIGKSTVCKGLFGEEWFTDDMPKDLNNKDAAMSLAGKWCIEWGEIEQLIKAEAETVKAFLSRQVDYYRPPYGKGFVEKPRQSVLIGTTNQSAYLRDVTGNRRIWPVKCAFADVDWMLENREQLWAEAAAREAAGEAIWLDDADLRAAAAEMQEARMEEDTWERPIREWVLDRTEVVMAQVLSDALNIPKDRQGRREQNRASAVLTSLGWVRSVQWRDKKSVRMWIKAPE